MDVTIGVSRPEAYGDAGKERSVTGKTPARRLEVVEYGGSRTALANAIEDYGGLVRHICRNIIGARSEDIDECVSDVFTALWQSMGGGGFDPGRGGVKGYLCGIARNKALNVRRRISGEPVFVPIDAYGSPGEGPVPGADTGRDTEAMSFDPMIAEMIDSEGEASALADAVLSMSDPDRSIIVLRYWYCERVRDIAAQLGLSEKAVEGRLARCRKALRGALEDRGVSRNNRTEAYDE